MKRSKIDRIRDLVHAAVREAIEDLRLHEHACNRHAEAATLARLQDQLTNWAVANFSDGTYKRLELQDIIDGRKRAWPDPKAEVPE